MSWIEHHENSERLASQAQVAAREGRRDNALTLYARAAAAEELALADLDPSKKRTLGISAVSAASLYYKADSLKRAEAVAVRWLGFDPLPAFAGDQLRILLQSIWSEQVRDRADARFAPGQVLISVQGGEIVHGGAPLDLIAEKVKTIQSIFYRTAEFMSGMDHRKRGAPCREIQDSCRPWLFQAAPSSYQFAVAIQEEYQLNFLQEVPTPRKVADCFLQILRVGIEDPEESFAKIVPKADYRSTFLKLTRNLAPDGKICDRLDVRFADEAGVITLDTEARKNIGRVIRKIKQQNDQSATQPRKLNGMLRAVHLDKDWLELATVDNVHLRVDSVGEEVDDVIGHLVNKPVIVYAYPAGQKYKFLDIEPAGGA